MSEGYFLPVSPGLLDPKHVAAIGPSIWVFLWMIKHTTREEGGEGIVLNGATIRSQAIAESLGLRDRTVRDHLNILCDGGYLRRNGSQSPAGQSYYVQKSKKWRPGLGGKSPTKSKLLGENSPQLGENSPQLGENSPNPHTPLKEEQKEQKGTGGRDSRLEEATSDGKAPAGLPMVAYANGLMENCCIPIVPATQMAVAAAIGAFAREHSQQPHEAVDELERLAKAAMERGEDVNKWWFTDRKWARKGGANGNRAQQRTNANRAAAEAALTRMYGADDGIG